MKGGGTNKLGPLGPLEYLGHTTDVVIVPVRHDDEHHLTANVYAERFEIRESNRDIMTSRGTRVHHHPFTTPQMHHGAFADPGPEK